MCAFVDLCEDGGMMWKTGIWQMDVRRDPKWKEGMKDLVVEHKDLEWMEDKDLEWTWKMNDGKLQVWKEQEAYQHLERLFVQWDTYHFQQKMRVHVDGIREWIGWVEQDHMEDQDWKRDYEG